MPSDLTRTSDDVRQGYKSPIMQQGRVALDRDFNALQETAHRAIESDALDIIGPCGTPDDGFAISLADSSPPPPPLWTPPAPLKVPEAGDYDFLIKPGTMYVGGQRVVFPGPGPGEDDFTYSYFDQPDWIRPTDLPGTDGSSPVTPPDREFVYLHLFEQEVSAVEDPDLKDAALGGPDTTQRLRVMRRVERMPIQATDCAGALREAASGWLKQGFLFDKRANQLLPQVKLLAGFTQPLTTKNYCDPIAEGGYLGAENQLIRVQVSNPQGAAKPKLVWGYDNTSFIYRVTQLDSQTLKLDQPPVDAFHDFFSGQVVEVLRTRSILADDPDATDPTGTGKILRCIAEPVGQFFTLAGPVKDSNVTLQQSLVPDSEEPQLFLRIWQGQADLTPGNATPIPLADALGRTPGVLVTLTTQSGTAALPDGAFWMLAVRPGTPQAIYPERFLESPQPPDGPRQWVCSLGRIDWNGGVGSTGSGSLSAVPEVYDCRNHFNNLVELSRRRLGGCCSVTLRAEDLRHDPGALQKAADRFAGVAQGRAICLEPGIYLLRKPLRLDSRHAGLTIEACHRAAVLQMSTQADPAAFLDGLVVLTEADNVTLQGLALQIPAAPLESALKQAGFTDERSLRELAANLNAPRVMIGIRAQESQDLIVRECELRATPPPAVGIFGAGIFAGGDCTGLNVVGTNFVGPGAAVTGTPEETRGPLAFFAGFLMTPSLGDPGTEDKTPRLLARAVLDKTVFGLNFFSGLTVAALAAADTGTVRFNENTVTDCFAGFWLDSLGLSDAAGAEDLRKFYQTIFDGPLRIAIGQALRFAMFFPAPEVHLKQSAARRSAARSSSVRFLMHRELGRGGSGLTLLPTGRLDLRDVFGQIPGTALTPRFYLTNNQIDALPANDRPSGYALLIFAKSAEDGGNAPGESTVLVNANELRATWSPYTALIAGAKNNNVCGNIILNQLAGKDTTGKLPFSLGVILPPNGAMVVTGNLLNCQSDLRSNPAANIRVRKDILSFAQSPELQQLNFWNFLNSEPRAPGS